MKNDQVKILWDFIIQTDRVFEATKPDTAVVEMERKKEKRKLKMRSHRRGPGPVDYIRSKVIHKFKKYTDIYIEVSRMWNIQSQ